MGPADFLKNELPEFLACGLCYAGDVPYWEPAADAGGWEVRAAPPRGGPEWTLPEG
ncbi:hypothetical protein [Streptomyces sp. NPDC004134]|uniref:hypothetical protein n=1 Tax=Streptomyces sp. NPDC004134 TaxID=3364691 RepID=UPI0036B0EAB7